MRNSFVKKKHKIKKHYSKRYPKFNYEKIQYKSISLWASKYSFIYLKENMYVWNKQRELVDNTA